MPAVVVVAVTLQNELGLPISRNFTTFVVRGTAVDRQRSLSGETLAFSRIPVSQVHEAKFSGGHSFAAEGKKFNGLGEGFVEYKIPWPQSLPKSAQTGSDTFTNPGALVVSINGERAGRYELPDDPADHRGILSWHNQPEGPRFVEQHPRKD